MEIAASRHGQILNLNEMARDIKQFELLDKLALRGEGGVICMYDKLVSLSDKDKVIPVGYL